MVKTHGIHNSFVSRNLVIATFTSKLKAECLLLREVKQLEGDGDVNHEAVKKRVYRLEIGKCTVIQQLQTAFKWRQRKETLLETNDEKTKICT